MTVRPHNEWRGARALFVIVVLRSYRSLLQIYRLQNKVAFSLIYSFYFRHSKSNLNSYPERHYMLYARFCSSCVDLYALNIIIQCIKQPRNSIPASRKMSNHCILRVRLCGYNKLSSSKCRQQVFLFVIELQLLRE